ncbi:hypothetical protein VTI28DRAFT_7504 [Corynascus sepedonium]
MLQQPGRYHGDRNNEMAARSLEAICILRCKTTRPSSGLTIVNWRGDTVPYYRGQILPSPNACQEEGVWMRKSGRSSSLMPFSTWLGQDSATRTIPLIIFP